VRGLSTLLQQHVVSPLNEAGIAIDLRGVQVVIVLAPVAIVVLAFMVASWRKRQRMRDAGMQ